MRSSRSHIGIVNIILLTANSAHITDTNNTLCTTLFTYIEKKVSAHNPRPSIKINIEKDITLIDIGIEKKSFFIT
ncbi:MAG: hypothetical protein WCG25_03745 [bacterium]